jgi:hypothetical protein
MGVSPATDNLGAAKFSALVKSIWTFTGPKVMTGVSMSQASVDIARYLAREAPGNAFDMLAGAGEDFRAQALVMRKSSLARLLSRPVDGIFIAEYEQGDMQTDIGNVLFRVACNMNLEGIVSKRLDRAYGAGRCAHWSRDLRYAFVFRGGRTC